LLKHEVPHHPISHINEKINGPNYSPFYILETKFKQNRTCTKF
jgi:hypothetical protein